MFKVVKTHASNAPKASALKDVAKQIEVSTDNTDKISKIFQYAIVELGRQIAKQYNGSNHVAAAGIAAQVHEAISKVESGLDNNYQFRNMMNEEYGFANNWLVTDNCGNQRSMDISDLYEDTEVTLVIQVQRRVKDKKSLAKLGVK